MRARLHGRPIAAWILALSLGAALLGAGVEVAVDHAAAKDGNGGQGNQGQGKGNSGDHGKGSSDDSGQGSGKSGKSGESGAGDDGTGNGGSSRGGGEGRRYVAREVVVVSEQDADLAGVKNLGFSVLDRRPLGALGLTVTRLRVPEEMSAPEAQALLQRRFPELVADLNALYAPQGQETLPSPSYPRQLIGWTRSPEGCGAGFRVGLVDTGVDVDLPAFAGRHVVERSFLDQGQTAADTAHGSAVAGLLVGAGGQGSGLLPGAELRVASIFEESAPGAPAASVIAVARALDWLVEEQVPVVNLSLAGEGNALLALAVARATARGTVLVAAGGNGGPDMPPAYPAGYPQVVAVTPVDWDLRPAPDAPRGDHIDFAAPGVRVWAPGPGGGGYRTGSSFAAPFVTAAAAAWMMRGAVADRVEAALAGRALDLGAPGRDPVFGWGLVQPGEGCSVEAAHLP